MRAPEKLTLVLREDLAPGAQLAQVLHAGLAFAREHRAPFEAWQDASNTVAVLAVPDERALERLVARAREAGVPVVCWREPDRADELTAVALGPGPETRRLCRGLPLAGRGR